MTITRGFGMALDLQSGKVRKWILKDGVKRWADTNQIVCEYCSGSGKIETDNNGPIVNCPVCNGIKD